MFVVATYSSANNQWTAWFQDLEGNRVSDVHYGETAELAFERCRNSNSEVQ